MSDSPDPPAPLLHLEVQQVSVVYSNGHHALRDATFALSGGTICALVG